MSANQTSIKRSRHTLRPWFYCQGRNRSPLKALEIKGFAGCGAFLNMTVKQDLCCMYEHINGARYSIVENTVWLLGRLQIAL